MDQAQNRALAALQPFLHLALTTKSPSPRILADFIIRATSAQGTYVFTELLQTPAIQSLRSPSAPEEFRNYYTALEIFSYGTLADYQNAPNLPTLTPQQQHKLTLLTLLSLASEPHPLTYDYLTTTLYLDSAAALEALITEAIYSGLITARLSPTSSPPIVHITSVAPLRDLRPNSLPEILKVLQVWESRCSSVVGDIEAQIAGIRNNAAKRKAREMRRQEVVDTAVLSNDGTGDVGNAAGGGAGAGTGVGSGATGGAGRMTRSSIMRGGSGDENRKSKGTGNKRDLDEQQEDEEVSQWGQQTSEEDGGVGVGLAKMEVDEGAGSMGKSGDGSRTAKRVLGKKGL
ncbi:hypothetical protein EPUS_00139 [Endocarpon pusillum Z07020]|uniref:PCI domain-containing protein n=1 Tax=Endocarpon pusillum (strain Z07020 / HMAS-L-300199) TaxID=1263415 RepID=U1GTJ9_ENDPU|nr:uncharacterized protein EPUS_00139 [Endocarpon pusillum Z07020]ERF75346.1 hypothetical protein EPUS_00139 [Endocarpon pusillum Z07020]